jgi:multidrug efflux pump subunit AcrA (membrane-fusion protein)
MTNNASIAGMPPHDETWRQIERLVDEVQGLVQEGGEEGPFYAALLDRAVRAGAAVGGAVWAADADHRFQLVAAYPSKELPWAANPAAAARHEQFLSQVGGSTDVRTAAPLAVESAGRNPASPYPLVACPVVCEESAIRIVEICQRPDVSPEAARGYAEVLSALCELAADYHRRARLKELRQREWQWDRARLFCEHLQRPLDLLTVAYAVANEGRRVLGYDRVTVAVRRRGRLRVQAISGLDSFDPRATPVCLLERLAEHVAASAAPLFYAVAGPAKALPLEAALEEYVDQTHTRTLTAIPLAEPAPDGDAPPAPHGVLVLESFTPQPTGDADRAMLEWVCRQASLAVARAVRYERIPAVRLWERWARWCRTGRTLRMALWSLPPAAAVAALIFVPAEFRVTCRGQLRPRTERRIFAPRDGRVERLHADHGDAVAANQLLAALQSSDLDYEWTRLLGEIQTTTEQLDSLRTARLGAQSLTADQRDESIRQTAEEERLKKLLASLHEQRRLLDVERDALQLRSPIAGHMLTWDPADTLQQRPVKRGQALMTVADTSGPWILVIEVPDRDAGYVLAARRALQPDLPVRFILATNPSQIYKGRLEKLAEIAEADQRQQLSVTARVRVEASAIPHRLAGAGVVARIDCGRRALGYVWLHDLIEAVRSWLFV